MSAISREEVAHLAALARIDLRSDELDRLAQELDVILDAVAPVQHGAGEGGAAPSPPVQQAAGEDVPPPPHPMPRTNVPRPDEPRPCLPVDEVLAGAPEAE